MELICTKATQWRSENSANHVFKNHHPPKNSTKINVKTFEILNAMSFYLELLVIKFKTLSTCYQYPNI